MVRQPPSFDLVTGIYDASLDPDLWPAVLEMVADTVRADVGLVFAVDFRTGSPAFLHATEDSPLIDMLGREHMDNPWSRASMRNPAGTIARTERLVPLNDLYESDFWGEVLEPAGLLYALGANLTNEGGVMSCSCFMRPRGSRAFGTDELDRMRSVLPHFQRAARIALRLADVDMSCRGCLEVLHRLSSPVFLLDAGGWLLFLNAQAEDLVSADGALRVSGGRLRTRAQDLQGDLDRLVDAAARLDVGGRAEWLTLPGGELPIVLQIAPFRARGLHVAGGEPSVAVFAGRPGGTDAVMERALASAFGLTPTEARVARLVARGWGLERVARELGVRKNTVRTHTARIFGKTGTRRQAELAHLLLSVLPSVRDAGE